MVTRIEARDLGVRYGQTPVWSHINLSLTEPGLVSIIGPNGVGKSTFMYCVNKQLSPDEGTMLLDDVDVETIKYKEIAKKIAYVPQASGETFAMTVMDTVLMGRYPHSGFNYSESDLEIAANCIKLMGISDLAMRNFNELSAGQHQRVMIARGLAQQPDVLMLDEPTSNLDIFHQIHVMQMLKDIAHEKKITVLIICHDLNVASRFSDRIIILHKGAVFADGVPNDIITADTISDVYGVRTDVIEVDGRPYVIFHAEENASENQNQEIKQTEDNNDAEN